MGKIAFVFPGQGAQRPGMGRELYENSKAAKAVFEMAEKLRPGTTDLCFNGTEEELARTDNTQPCLYCAELAAYAALCDAGMRPDMLAGFSLGELTALAVSGAVSFEDGYRLVCERGRLMRTASEKTDAAMAAVLKLYDIDVIRLCGEFQNVYPVNFNCSGQVVVAGLRDELGRFKERVREKGGKMLPLKVGGGFHSPFMSEASTAFAHILDGFELLKPKLPIYANATAEPYADDLKQLLSLQIRSPVMWRATVVNMLEAGADTFVEIGPGTTLAGLITRISGNVRVYSAGDTQSIQKTCEEAASRC